MGLHEFSSYTLGSPLRFSATNNTVGTSLSDTSHRVGVHTQLDLATTDDEGGVHLVLYAHTVFQINNGTISYQATGEASPPRGSSVRIEFYWEQQRLRQRFRGGKIYIAPLESTYTHDES